MFEFGLINCVNYIISNQIKEEKNRFNFGWLLGFFSHGGGSLGFFPRGTGNWAFFPGEGMGTGIGGENPMPIGLEDGVTYFKLDGFWVRARGCVMESGSGLG